MKIKDLYNEVVLEDMKHEYKSQLNHDNPLKWAKSIVAFANGSGGIIFVGVSNDGEAFGLSLDEIDKAKNLVAITVDRHIFPHAKISYTMRSVDANAEKFVLGIKVSPSDSIVRYRDGDFNETVYVKGDGNSTPASPEDIISLGKRKFGVDNESTKIRYDESKWTAYIELCRSYREDNSTPTLKELQNEEVVDKTGFVKSGMMMFGDQYTGDDTLICCRLWKGLNKTGTVLDNGRYKGSLSNVFQATINFIERNTKTGWRKNEAGGRSEVRAYPKEAIREVLVNAIAHRDYSIHGTQIDVDIYDNRIEIVSPGSWLLPKEYDRYPVGAIPSIRRNPIISACLDVANLMERGGTGFQTMIEAYKDSSEEIQPVVSIYPGYLNLRLYDKLFDDNIIKFDFDNLSDKDKVLAIIKAEGPSAIKSLQEKVGYNSRSLFLKEVINPLIADDKIYRDGEKKSPKALIKIK